MGKAGRFACIFLPMVGTIASLVCLIIVGLGGTNQHNTGMNNLYFFRANTSHIQVNSSILNLPSNPVANNIPNINIINGSSSPTATALGIKDFYHISLWNYCSGDFSKNSSGQFNDEVTFCSPHQNEFWFNPVEVWKLNNTVADKLFSKELKAGLDTYKTVAKWMFICYIVAVISTIVEILVGFTALFSRLGSVATTIVSSISSLFLIGFALTSTILYSTLVASFNTALKEYQIHANIGRTIYIWVWLAVAFSLASGFFWMISSCCCSGRSDRIKGYNDGGRKGRKNAPYNYERVESPYMGHSGNAPSYQAPLHGMPMQNMGPQRTAYEPFRHEGA